MSNASGHDHPATQMMIMNLLWCQLSESCVKCEDGVPDRLADIRAFYDTVAARAARRCWRPPLGLGLRRRTSSGSSFRSVVREVRR
jgi:hypothetical protein